MDKRRDIHEYLDGRLKPARRRAFEEALARDPELARRVAELRQVKHLLAALPAERPPVDLTAGIMAQVRRKPVPRRGPAPVLWLLDWARPRRLATATVLATVLVVAGTRVRPQDGAEWTEPNAPRPARIAAQLSDTDQAFLRQAEREYHTLMAQAPAPGEAVETIDDVLRDF